MTADDIVKRECARFFRLSRRDLEGRSVNRRITGPRQIAMALCRFYSRSSTTQIGSVHGIGGRDHTTVLHASDQVVARLADPEFCDTVRTICALIEQQMLVRAIASANRLGWTAPARLLPAPPKRRRTPRTAFAVSIAAAPSRRILVAG